MNKAIMKRNALEAMMLVIFVLSVLFMGAGTIPVLGFGISTASLALLN